MDAAQPGDALVLPAGSVLPPLRVPPIKGDGWITLMSDRADALRPDDVVDETDLGAMVTTPGISAGAGTGGWRFLGVEVARSLDPATVYALVAIQDAVRLAFDRCYIHGHSDRPTRRGVMANGADLSFTDCRVDRIHETGADSQAICGWDGAHRILIDHCSLLAATENIMFGGADSASTERVPSDITVRHSRLWKDASVIGYPQKNLLELKSARRVLVEDCDLSWPGGGVAIVLTPRNQEGRAPWSCVEDVRLRLLRVRGGASLLSGQTTDDAHPSGRAARITIEDCLGLDISDWAWYWGSGPGAVMMADLTIENVTCLPCRRAPFWIEATFSGLSLQRNVFGAGSYSGQPVDGLAVAVDAASTISRNVLVNAGDVDGSGPERNRGFNPALFESRNPADLPIDLTTGAIPLDSPYADLGYQEESTMPTIEERLTALEQGGTALEGQATALDPRIAALESGTASVESRLAALETSHGNLAGRLTLLEGRVAALEAAHR